MISMQPNISIRRTVTLAHTVAVGSWARCWSLSRSASSKALFQSLTHCTDLSTHTHRIWTQRLWLLEKLPKNLIVFLRCLTLLVLEPFPGTMATAARWTKAQLKTLIYCGQVTTATNSLSILHKTPKNTKYAHRNIFIHSPSIFFSQRFFNFFLYFYITIFYNKCKCKLSH